jgi:hypothetical protein
MSELFSAASLGMAIDGAISRLVHDLTSPQLAPREELERAIARYRAAREETLAIIQDLTQAHADFFPDTKAWSIGQNVEHLLLTEKLYRTLMQKLIDLAIRDGGHGGKRNIELSFDQVDNSLAFIPRDVIPKLAVPLNVLNLFVPRVVRDAMFRFPLVPALNPSASEPARTQPIAELRSRAVLSLNATEKIFCGELPSHLMDMTLSHPILGTNNIAQLLGILRAHEERHHGQIRAVLANSRFPSNQLGERSPAV